MKTRQEIEAAIGRLKMAQNNMETHLESYAPEGRKKVASMKEMFFTTMEHTIEVLEWVLEEEEGKSSKIDITIKDLTYELTPREAFRLASDLNDKLFGRNEDVLSKHEERLEVISSEVIEAGKRGSLAAINALKKYIPFRGDRQITDMTKEEARDLAEKLGFRFKHYSPEKKDKCLFLAVENDGGDVICMRIYADGETPEILMDAKRPSLLFCPFVKITDFLRERGFQE